MCPSQVDHSRESTGTCLLILLISMWFHNTLKARQICHKVRYGMLNCCQFGLLWSLTTVYEHFSPISNYTSVERKPTQGKKAAQIHSEGKKKKTIGVSLLFLRIFWSLHFKWQNMCSGTQWEETVEEKVYIIAWWATSDKREDSITRRKRQDAWPDIGDSASQLPQVIFLRTLGNVSRFILLKSTIDA